MPIEYRELKLEEINLELFQHFNRYQVVEKCYRKEGGAWVIKDVSFIDQWDQANWQYLIQCLQNTVQTGGCVCAAIKDGILIGFGSVENEFFGTNKQYLQLSSLHISHESRGGGIGRELFRLIARKARLMGAQKLYISAHSAIETQAFYRHNGCVDAAEVHAGLAEKEPFDCQLEYSLSALVSD